MVTAHPLRVTLLAAGWLAAAGLLVVCGLHLIQPLGSPWTIAAIGVSPLILPLALPLGLLAGLARRWILVVACLASLVGWAVWAGPELLPFSTAPAARGPGVTILDANVSQANRNPTQLGALIARDDPDVVVLEELTPPALASLEADGLLARYPWSSATTRFGAGGMGLFSRIPTSGLSTWTVGRGQLEIDGWLHPAGIHPLRIDGVHVYAPALGHRSGAPATWLHQLGLLRAHLAAEPRPLVVAGDFNATWDLRPFQRILALGLSDTAVLAGRGWEMTWPRDQAWVIPYLRLDHVLISGRLTVTSYRCGGDRGSDHRSLLVTVADRA